MRVVQRFLVRAAVSIFILLAASGPLYAASFSFAVLCDSQGNNNLDINADVLSALVTGVLKTDARFVLFPGDLVQGEQGNLPQGSLAAQLAHWRGIMSPMYASSNLKGAKVYAGPGNHEMQSAGAEAVWQSLFSDLPANGPAGETYMTYSFDFLNAHFVMLDVERAGSRHTVNMTWLAADLASTKAKHIFVFGHEPAFPVGLHTNYSLDIFPDQRDAFWALLAQYRVDIYFCGHEHVYRQQEVKGVQQVISGTAGGPPYGLGGEKYYNYLLVTVDGAKVSVDVIDNYEMLRNHFEYVKPTPLPATSWLLGAGVLGLAGGRWALAHKGWKAAGRKSTTP